MNEEQIYWRGTKEYDELFESRHDVENLMLILQEWQKDHPHDSKTEDAEELFDKLDYIHMV